MELSNKSEYALLALLEPLDVHLMIVDPDRYLEQLLAMLRRAGLVRSQRGAKGGYLLAREPWKIDLLEVVSCIEGLDQKPVTPSDEPTSSEGVVIREVWQAARKAADQVLKGHTLQDLIEKRDARKQLDIMYYI